MFNCCKFRITELDFLCIAASLQHFYCLIRTLNSCSNGFTPSMVAARSPFKCWLSLFAGTSVDPDRTASRTASWMNMYCSSIWMKSVVNQLRWWDYRTCTMLLLWLLNAVTQPKMSMVWSYRSRSSIISITMKAPVRPTPALQGKKISLWSGNYRNQIDYYRTCSGRWLVRPRWDWVSWLSWGRWGMEWDGRALRDRATQCTGDDKSAIKISYRSFIPVIKTTVTHITGHFSRWLDAHLPHGVMGELSGLEYGNL